MNADPEFEAHLARCVEQYEALPEEKKGLLGAYKLGFQEEE